MCIQSARVVDESTGIYKLNTGSIFTDGARDLSSFLRLKLDEPRGGDRHALHSVARAPARTGASTDSCRKSPR